MPNFTFDNTKIAFDLKKSNALRKAYVLFSIINSPLLTKLGSWFALLTNKIYIPGAKWLIKNTLFELFCGGENLLETRKKLKALGKKNVSIILDYAVEGNESEEEFERAKNDLVQTIEFSHQTIFIDVVSLKITALTRFNLLEKISSGESLTKEEQAQKDTLYQRLTDICKMAYTQNIRVFIDAEESWIQGAIDELADKMMSIFNQKEAIIFNTYQVYRHDRLAYLKKSHKIALKNNYFLGVKLVRGAYMEKENERAKKMNYPSPIQPNKEATDQDFDLGISYCLENNETIRLCAASHNEQSAKHLTEEINKHGIAVNRHPDFFSAQLYGMSDHITFNLARSGYKAYKYVPFGPIKEVIPYLIRRAEENKSVAGQTNRELELIRTELKRRKMLKKSN